MDSRILCSFYRCTIERILTGCITAWYRSCTALNRKALQRVVKAAQHITRTELPSMEDLYTQRIRAQTTRLRDSFIPQAIRLLNCDLQHVLEWFAAKCETAGMRISTSKSEAMVLDRKRVALSGWVERSAKGALLNPLSIPQPGLSAQFMCTDLLMAQFVSVEVYRYPVEVFISSTVKRTVVA
ncbi:hypothetical protein L3Q82_000664 [Scortum barcoo]|uniref:Uncharacterized protein n=1 Tax=Scortum barcoo TaxID=214431 RepID=A0ACB8WGY7_9TELE|nr:hypothetical protein L3Q82_000664 [Scortum barcoo]